MTYALGDDVKTKGVDILKQIASENGGLYTRVLDKDSETLNLIMALYYDYLNGTIVDDVILSLPYFDTYQLR